ncbi:MAG: tRNA pseudouridine(55) synthase TruB [Chloroflexi bacterium]|nr:tRNA pseudouridine(55) synthase TruB [Chloroflexota bacterium]
MAVSGILNINKPRGWTSHDVVARVRRLSRQRRVGHAGTLDPQATGVLIVCLGKATRVAEYLADADKRYLATVRFGATTDTWDAEGRIVEERPWEHLTLAAIEAAAKSLEGSIEQTPPMYSALKREGQPLYRLARRGLTVERAARPVEIHRLDIRDWQPPDLVVEVHCSKGTYIRALAHDLGQTLGTGAYLAALVRTAVGRFRLENATDLDTLMGAEDDGAWQRYLLPISEGLSGLPCVTVGDDIARRIVHGRAVPLSEPAAPFVCAYDERGRLLAILRPDGEAWRPHKVLLDEHDVGFG